MKAKVLMLDAVVLHNPLFLPGEPRVSLERASMYKA